MNSDSNTVKLWPAHRLPLPLLVAEAKDVPEAAVVSKQEVIVPDDDLFPNGEVIKYYPNQGCGFIRDRVGREIYFSISEMDFVGEKRGDAIRNGSPVGYDLSQTSKGLHVKKMKVY